MNIYKIFIIGFIGIALLTTITVFSNEIYAPFQVGNGFVQNNNITLSIVDQENKTEKFIQQNNFTVTEVKDDILKFGGMTSSRFVDNGTMSVHLEFTNGSQISYNNVKTLGIEYGRGFVQNNNNTISGGDFGKGFVNLGEEQTGNGFVQNNNIILGSGGSESHGFTSTKDIDGNELGNGFVQNNNIAISGGHKAGNAFVKNNFVRGGWISGG